jgi:phosphoribosyl 1,2-cyclic phosphate phosphodiesterase
MSLSLTILGCGSSAGVPRPALGWGDCDPANPKNRRRRCSVLVEQRSEAGVTKVLVDTSPDLREQLLDARVDRLDAVLYTHEHADQTHGIDDLRTLAIAQRGRVPVYLNQSTATHLLRRFGYCFETPPGSDYPPILERRGIEAGATVEIVGKGGALSALAFDLQHGNISALGFRFGGLAYTPDVNAIPPESLEALAGLDVWVIDGLRYTPHPSHFNIDDALGWIERLKPRRAVITNMTADVDYETLRKTLPANVVPAYDGMVISEAPANR